MEVIKNEHSVLFNDKIMIFVTTENKKAGDSQKVKPLKWEEDMQLYSNFLDRKVSVIVTAYFK